MDRVRILCKISYYFPIPSPSFFYNKNTRYFALKKIKEMRIMQNYNCKKCGAVLFWDPKTECLKCDFCDSTYQVSDFEDQTTTEEKVKDEALDNDYVASEISEDMVVYACKTCGGEVVALKTTMATICPYCGEAISITSKSVGEFRPELVIPFVKDKKEIMEIYKNYVNASFLTPKAFKEQNTIEKIQGMFVPFYLHSMKDHTRHTFSGETVSSSKIEYDKVNTHKVYELSIEANGTYNRIPTDASKAIDDAMMESVEPFNYKKLKEYNPAYMAGFVAEQGDDSREKMKTRAEKRVSESMEQNAKKQFPLYLNLKKINETNHMEDYSSEYVMLPVWFLNVNHAGKKYLFAINGQSGKAVGRLPIDMLKLVLIGLGSFIGLDLLIALIRIFIF